MAISNVNGFLCTSSCDVAKAKLGQDPQPATAADKIDAEKNSASSRISQADQPAVLFGGSLSELSGINSAQTPSGTQAADVATRWNQKSTVDLLA
jgi:hypothetical protein